ncbi:MAG: TIGR03668 family PPOX class F420-dependent oxidoreductase [Roseiflexaceae bacterium]|nr:TIGR03668 family PPOX class F420-dependent oxidoreductase [Roseiflexaceae bacterium]
MTAWERDFIANGRVARMATVGTDGQPAVVPIVYAFDGRLYTPIDAKPKQVEAMRLRRVKNIQANPHVAIVVDYYSENWDELAWVLIRGTAVVVAGGADYVTGIDLLRQKYPQYATLSLSDSPLIIVTPTAIRGWRAHR